MPKKGTGESLIEDERISAFGLLVEAHARLERLLGRLLAQECGVPHAWFEVLLRIARAPDQRLTMGQLADEVVLTTGGVTRLVDRLEAAGYLARRPSPADRRVQHVTLTDEGRAKLEEACAIHARNLDEHFVGRLTRAELSALTRALAKLRQPPDARRGRGGTTRLTTPS